MNLHDISILKRDPLQEDLYDLSEPTFAYTTTTFYSREVLPEEEMRPDLISSNIYGTPEYADILASVNDMIDPLNFRSGMTMIYPDPSNIINFRVTPPDPITDTNALLNSSARANIKDPRRQEFLENNFRNSPTVLDVPQNPIQILQNSILISPV